MLVIVVDSHPLSLKWRMNMQKVNIIYTQISLHGQYTFIVPYIMCTTSEKKFPAKEPIAPESEKKFEGKFCAESSIPNQYDL